MTTRQTFLERMPTPEAQRAAKRLMRVAEENGARVNPEKMEISIRCPCRAWPNELSVSWIYPWPGERGWRKTADFSFGAGNGTAGFFEGPPDHLRECLENWADQFSTDGFTRDVSSKGVMAWSMSHEAAVAHIDLPGRPPPKCSGRPATDGGGSQHARGQHLKDCRRDHRGRKNPDSNPSPSTIETTRLGGLQPRYFVQPTHPHLYRGYYQVVAYQLAQGFIEELAQ